jgi:membrane fusion protein, multidrug efflux system
MKLEIGPRDVQGTVVTRRSGLLGQPRAAATLGLASLLLLALAGCESKAAMPSSFERPPSPVSVAPAVVQDVPVYLDAIGKSVAREVVSIQPQVSGRITEIRFSDGADVKTGDLLFTIDPRPYQAQLDAAEANLAQAKAVLALAKIEANRVTDLVNSRAVSKSDVDTKRNAVDVAEAQIKLAEASLATARLNLEYCSIRSPIDGRAGQRLVDLGNVVTPNSGPLLVIQKLDPIYAEFTIAENDLGSVQKSMAQSPLKVQVRLPDEQDAPREGELTFLDNSVLESTGTVKLRATVPNGDHRFWPGRFVKIRLVLSTIPGAVLIPAAAPQMSAKGPFVYVVKEDSTAELRPVTPGQRQGDLLVVEQGVKPGEKIVVNGQMGVMPGGKVRVEEPEAPKNPEAKTPGAKS